MTQSGLRRVCDVIPTPGAIAKLLHWFHSSVELLQKLGAIGERVVFALPRARLAHAN
jgi:hypothetical protein